MNTFFEFVGFVFIVSMAIIIFVFILVTIIERYTILSVENNQEKDEDENIVWCLFQKVELPNLPELDSIYTSWTKANEARKLKTYGEWTINYWIVE